MAQAIPCVLINAKVYNDAREMLGIGNVELPDFEYMTESIAGLGIAGELDIPVLGHTKSMKMTINWNSTNKDAISLWAPKTHRISVYASIQGWNAGEGSFSPTPLKVVALVTPTKSGIGKFEPGKKMEPASEFEITYIKMSLGGEEVLEIDKVNSICRISGTDYLATVRSHLGM